MQKVAHIYMRVSTSEQSTDRQEKELVSKAEDQGYCVVGTYKDKASGTTHDRPELHRMIAAIRPGDVVIAEKIDRITRAPLADAEALIAQIEAKGARLSVPGLLDLSDIEAEGMTSVILDSMQKLMLRIVLQMARDDYETRRERQRQGIEIAKAKGVYKGRPRDEEKRELVLTMLGAGKGVRETARLAKVSPTTVTRIKKEQAR
ncbi:recombinase family protein [Cobetia sp. 1CM21F]|uniref:recombinase family protein n=1 Tax=Cobetia sp. 1CM21F TaxID=2929163 RepID=UPI0020BD9E98|nr:recombinase family protein [Cobetia sp. 1CM21F]MCK8069805.1 recombinase family protein [Cobetia sp. 1CM21F]